MRKSDELHAKMVEFAERAEAAEAKRNAAREKDPSGRSAAYEVAEEEASLANCMLRDIATEWRVAARQEAYPREESGWRMALSVLIGLIIAAAIVVVFAALFKH